MVREREMLLVMAKLYINLPFQNNFLKKSLRHLKETAITSPCTKCEKFYSLFKACSF